MNFGAYFSFSYNVVGQLEFRDSTRNLGILTLLRKFQVQNIRIYFYGFQNYKKIPRFLLGGGNTQVAFF